MADSNGVVCLTPLSEQKECKKTCWICKYQ